MVSANQYPRSCKNEAKQEHQNQQDILPVAVLPKSSIQNDLYVNTKESSS